MWKLLSDEYGDYNVTRDLHFSFLKITGSLLLVDGWLFDGLRYICFLTSLRTRGNSFKSKCKMTMEITAKSVSLVCDQ